MSLQSLGTAALVASVSLCAARAVAQHAPLAPLPAEGPPPELAYEWWAMPSPEERRVRVAGDTVVFTSGHPGPTRFVGTTARRVPSAAEWRAFWRAVRDAGVERWPADCTNAGVDDGWGFRFALGWAGARRAGSFANAFPTRGGACRPGVGRTPEASAFEQAVRRLAGANSARGTPTAPGAGAP